MTDDDSAADVLAALTGRPREDFEADNYPIPDFADQRMEPKE